MSAVKILFSLGILLIVLAAIIWIFQRFGIPLGRLPGDIRIEKPGFSFYFPLATCVLLSALLTLGAWLFRYFK